jgi:nitrogen fixation/metabolism regulation signal transduction histidine kinase
VSVHTVHLANVLTYTATITASVTIIFTAIARYLVRPVRMLVAQVEAIDTGTADLPIWRRTQDARLKLLEQRSAVVDAQIADLQRQVQA